MLIAMTQTTWLDLSAQHHMVLMSKACDAVTVGGGALTYSSARNRVVSLYSPYPSYCGCKILPSMIEEFFETYGVISYGSVWKNEDVNQQSIATKPRTWWIQNKRLGGFRTKGIQNKRLGGFRTKDLVGSEQKGFRTKDLVDSEQKGFRTKDLVDSEQKTWWVQNKRLGGFRTKDLVGSEQKTWWIQNKNFRINNGQAHVDCM